MSGAFDFVTVSRGKPCDDDGTVHFHFPDDDGMGCRVVSTPIHNFFRNSMWTKANACGRRNQACDVGVFFAGDQGTLGFRPTLFQLLLRILRDESGDGVVVTVRVPRLEGQYLWGGCLHLFVFDVGDEATDHQTSA